ncbi:MAG: helicase-related protein [Promethearchaeota archaeon]
MNLSSTPEYFNSNFIKKNTIHYRHYQDNIVKNCKAKNSLVVLPTGLGKTIIGILLIANALEKYNGKAKIIVLAPTRPLVAQHKASCEKFLDVDKNGISLLTGKISPERRIISFYDSRIIISTPQVIKNDLMRGRYDLSQVALIIFDEAHRTRGNYAYNFISNEYINTCGDPLILGLTASPGKDLNRIQQLCDNLCIEKIVYKSHEDEDVERYIYDIDTFIEKVDLPINYLEISGVWNNLFKKFLRFFIERNLINPYKKYYSKIDFLRICHDLTLSLKYEKFLNSDIFDEEFTQQLSFQSPKIIDLVKEKKLNIQSIFSYSSSCISLLHAKDLLETQDISLFRSFLEKISYKAEQDVLSAKRIANSEHFKFITSSFKKLNYSDSHHPKIDKLISIIKEELELFNNKKMIIFTQYRETAELLKTKLVKEFLTSEQLKIEKFIGQSTKFDDFGYSQNEQIKILDEFRRNIINILIATSVAEEGLDIPNVDSIIFYEPVPSEIRLIQRRGRTGRSYNGRCYILMTSGTVDVPFHLVACRKENEMKYVLTEAKQLKLSKSLERRDINLSSSPKCHSELELIKNFRERKDEEKVLLANRSIEEIIYKLDIFSKSSEFKKLKDFGVTFYSDINSITKSRMRNNILKIKGKKNETSKLYKKNLNKNIKTLINIAKNSGNGLMEFSKFQTLAGLENIMDKKFYAHFNQACNLGYLKKEKNYVRLIKDYG